MNNGKAFLVCQGSPPRVRGKVTVNGQTLSDFRITPACAGKSAGIDPSVRDIGDHPRVCGEKYHIIILLDCSSGITPACAGKSFWAGK